MSSMISSADLSSSGKRASLCWLHHATLIIPYQEILVTVFAQLLAGGVFKRLLPKARVFSRALYTFDIGQNDLTAGYFLNMTTDEVRAYIPDVLGQFKTYVKVASTCLISIFS